MADLRAHSSTSNLIRFTLKHATTGDGLTGLSSASSGLIISTIADNEATATTYTVAGSTIETITTLGTFAAPTATKCRFKEVDATNHPGVYEYQFADARFSVASAKRIVISVSGATNLLDQDYEIQLDAEVNTVKVSGTAQTANDNGADINTLLTRIVGTLAAGTHNPASAAQIAVLSDWIDGGRLDLLLDAIKVVTDAQGTTGSGLSAVPWNAAWDAEVQSEATDALVAFFTSSAQLVDDIHDEAIAGHLTAGSAGLYLAIAGGVILDTTATGTPTTTSLTITGGATGTDFYQDQLVWIISGTGVGQVRPVLNSSESGGVTTLTVDEAFKTAAVSGDRVIIQAAHLHTLTQSQSGLATSAELAKVPKSDGAVSWNATALAAINAEADTAISDAALATAADIAALNDIAASDVLTQVNAALDTAIAELGVGAPAATPTLRTGLMLMYMMARNRVDVDTTGTDALKIYNDAGTQIASKAITDDGTDYSEAEMS